MPCQSIDSAGCISHLRVAEHVHLIRLTVEIQRIAPALLSVGEKMHLAGEEEQFFIALVPSGIGRKHVVLFPRIGIEAEQRLALRRRILQLGRLDEHRVGEHIDVMLEDELLYLGVVTAPEALYDLPVLVPHGTALLEDRDAVLGVVIKIGGPQGIVVLVLELNYAAAELGEVVVDEVVEIVACQFGLVLEDLDVTGGLDKAAVHIPQGRVTDEIGVVVQEFGGAENLAVGNAALDDHLGRFGAHQAYETILVLRPDLCGQRQGRKEQNRSRKYLPDGFQHRYSLRNFSFQPSRLNSHSLKSGSITM